MEHSQAHLFSIVYVCLELWSWAVRQKLYGLPTAP